MNIDATKAATSAAIRASIKDSSNTLRTHEQGIEAAINAGFEALIDSLYPAIETHLVGIPTTELSECGDQDTK